MTHTVHKPPPRKAIVTISAHEVAGGLTELRWHLNDLVMDGACLVVIDVSDLDQLSSTLLSALLDTHRMCRRRGGGVVIRHANRRAADILRRTGLDRVVEVEAAA
jgi:anti-anti-sigma factor